MKRALKQQTTICGRCLARRCMGKVFQPAASVRRHFSSDIATHLPSTIPPAGHAHLTNRALISLTGQDASRFLQGLTTANIPVTSVATPTIAAPKPIATYSAFLNAQGRLLHDVFIYPMSNSDRPGLSLFRSEEESFLIEVDATEQDRLFRLLKRYKLRSKVSLRALDPEECGVWSSWDDAESSSASKKPTVPPNSNREAMIFQDLRAPGLGYRILLPQGSNSLSSTGKTPNTIALGLSNHSEHSSLIQYTLRRYLYGIPEGQGELPRESALLQESCLDYMGGVNFRKGCYVGQELVIRTQHTGVVRKRILPVLLYDNTVLPSETGATGPGSEETLILEYNAVEAQRMEQQIAEPLAGADVVKADGKGRRIAKLSGGLGNLGLALWRLETMKGEFTIKAGAFDGGETSEAVASKIRVKPFFPKWWDERKISMSSV
ncbi:Iron-sulfur clusters incorporation protein [Xylographa trunciseda]|nr:Iron-sulfur clusters incorporation protein [Xylographa trunciseda]